MANYGTANHALVAGDVHKGTLLNSFKSHLFRAMRGCKFLVLSSQFLVKRSVLGTRESGTGGFQFSVLSPQLIAQYVEDCITCYWKKQ